MMDVYKCTPLEYKQQPAYEIDLHVDFLMMRQAYIELEKNRDLMNNERSKRMK